MVDTTYRTGFGTGNFGVQAFGVDGVFKEGDGVVVSVTTTAAAVVRVRGSASAATTVLTSASGAERVREADAAATPAASVSASAARTVNVSATVTASASSVGACERVREADGSVSPAASVSASYERVRTSTDPTGSQGNVAEIIATGQASAEAVFLFSTTATTLASVSAVIERIVFGSAAAAPVCSVTANGIEKWEPPAVAVDTWTDYTPGTDSSIWSDAPAASSTSWGAAA